MAVKKLTPILFVEKIEAVLPFWTQHLGFLKTVEVPDGDQLAFVILQQNAIKFAIKGMNVYMPERTTFYGAREIGINDPAGHFITFAYFEKQG